MQAGRFLEKYGQLELFPVKLQVPLLMTIHIVMLSKCVHIISYLSRPAASGNNAATLCYRSNCNPGHG